jgi:hypothetical protein
MCDRGAVVDYGGEKPRRFCLEHIPITVLQLAVMQTPGLERLRKEVSMHLNIPLWVEQEREMLLRPKG